MMSTLFPALPTILSAADAAPPDADWQAAEALAMAGRSCQALEDYAGARRHFEAIIREPALLRSEPDAVATAFDSLHLLLLAENKPAAQRRRLLADFQRKLPASPLPARAHERESFVLCTLWWKLEEDKSTWKYLQTHLFQRFLDPNTERP